MEGADQGQDEQGKKAAWWERKGKICGPEGGRFRESKRIPSTGESLLRRGPLNRSSLLWQGVGHQAFGGKRGDFFGGASPDGSGVGPVEG